MSYADYSRNYALYIDGDIAKLPGGGRKGAAVLCELVPSQIQEPYDPYNDPRFGFQIYPLKPTSKPGNALRYSQRGRGGNPRRQYPSDGGYPNYPGSK